MSHKINPYIVIDFETGGLEGNKHAITEVACLCLTGDTIQEIGRYESYIKPYLYEYDQKALDVTGITFDKLNTQGKPLEEVVKDLVALFKDWRDKTSNTHTKKPILVGHNPQFDISFLQQIFKDNKEDLGKYIDGKNDFWGHHYPNYLDTISLSKLTWGNDESMTSYKLTNCVEKAGLAIYDAHKAMNDVEATKELLIKFINRLRSNDGGSGSSTRIRVRDHLRLHFPF